MHPLIIVYCGNPVDYASFEGVKYQQKEGTLPKNMSEVQPFTQKPEKKIFKDLSIASAFTVLRATELGLGTCYVGLINREKIGEKLSIPPHYEIPFVITVGYPAENPKQRKKKELNELILGKPSQNL